MPSPGGTIYAIGAVGTSWVKIGRTTGPVMKRLQTLQTGQPFPLQVLAAIPVETDAHRIERQVHAFLEAERRRGEWFDVPMDIATLEALIVRAVAYLAAREASQDCGEMEQGTMPTVGQRIRERRKQLGMSQQELARLLGLPQPKISELERDVRSDMLLSTARRVAQVLQMSLDDLAGAAPAAEPAPAAGARG